METGYLANRLGSFVAVKVFAVVALVAAGLLVGAGNGAGEARSPGSTVLGVPGVPANQAQSAGKCGVGLPPTSVTAIERGQMLTLHNELRARYGSPPLSWDDTLAACAQDWAGQRARTNDNPVHRPEEQFGPTRYGENTYNWASGDPNDPDLTPKGAMDNLWGAKEEADFDSTTGQCKPGTACEHFIQVVWSTTTRIGCGKTTVPDQTYPALTMAYWVCNYDPAGNSGGGPLTGAGPTADGGGSSPGSQNDGAGSGQ